jgi:hypothetical protein
MGSPSVNFLPSLVTLTLPVRTGRSLTASSKPPTAISNGTTAGPGGGGIFKITEAGKITVLYTFTTNPRTGFYDQGYDPTSLAEGTDGFLYGVNSAGGPNSASSGTIFKISKTGTGFQVSCG